MLENLPPDIPQRIATGDAQAESRLVEHYSRRIFALILGRTRDTELARDLTQDVLLGVLTALREGRLREHDALDAFVLATARNHIANFYRERSRRPLTEEVSTSLPAPALEDHLEIGERLDLLRKALRRLDAEEKQVLRLTAVDGLEPSEIAVRLGIGAEAARQRKSRALRKLAGLVAALQSRRPGKVY